MPETEINQEINEGLSVNAVLTNAQQQELHKILKCGIYKELYKRNMLSEAQLNSLLERNS